MLGILNDAPAVGDTLLSSPTEPAPVAIALVCLIDKALLVTWANIPSVPLTLTEPAGVLSLVVLVNAIVLLVPDNFN